MYELDSKSKFCEGALKEFLKYYGLGFFEIKSVRAFSDRGQVVRYLAHSLDIDIDGFREFGTDKLPELFAEFIDPIKEGIENSPHIASLKARHASECNDLREQIKRLEEQNMKLTEAFTNGMEYLDQISDNNPEKEV